MRQGISIEKFFLSSFSYHSKPSVTIKSNFCSESTFMLFHHIKRLLPTTSVSTLTSTSTSTKLFTSRILTTTLKQKQNQNQNRHLGTTATRNMTLKDNSSSSAASTEPLPKLSQKDFQRYNRMASSMEQFHNMFRLDWNEIYASVNTSDDSSATTASSATSASSASAESPAVSTTAIADNSKPSTKAATAKGKCNFPPPASKPLSTPRLLRKIQGFIQHLTAHHGIEEAHIFPHLATRMPVFQHSDVLKQQHAEIHDGLDKLGKYAKEVQNGKRDMRREEVKAILDGFGEVLWLHLDREVVELGADRMRKFWSLEEMDRMLF